MARLPRRGRLLGGWDRPRGPQRGADPHACPDPGLVGMSWAAERIVMLDAYDAGTDSGVTYASADRDTQPPEPIQRIEGRPLEANGVVGPVGQLVFRRLE